MRFARTLFFDSSFKRGIRCYCSQVQFFPVVKVVSLNDDDCIKVSLKINNSPFLNIKAPKNQHVNSVLSRIKLMAALQRKKQEMKREIIQKYSNTAQVAFETEEEDADVCLIRNNELIDHMTVNIDAWSEASILKIGDLEYEVQYNAPTITNMTLPDYIVSGCILRPHILMECASVEDCIFLWYRSMSIDKKGNLDWVNVGTAFHYFISNEDIDCHLKLVCTPQKKGKIGQNFTCISKNVVEAGPQVFPFEERHKWTPSISDKDMFRCISYNTLANMYVEKRKFPYASNKALDVYYRKQLLVRELLGYNSDIICLQEVQERVFEYDLFPILKEAGFDGFYTRKGGRRYEGLATFFKASKFRVLFNQGILLNEIVKEKDIFSDLLSKVGGNYKDMSKLLAQDTALQVVLLEAIENETFRILIANTHLYSNKDNPEVRLLQAALCVYYLEHLIATKSMDSVGVLFCGDFNSLPFSEAYNFLTSGNFQCSLSWKNNSMDSDSNQDNILQHNLFLESACGLPEYTNYTEEFQGCLDYIFYSKNSLEVADIVPFPSHESVTSQVGLPSELFPSDHIALICTIKQKVSKL